MRQIVKNDLYALEPIDMPWKLSLEVKWTVIQHLVRGKIFYDRDWTEILRLVMVPIIFIFTPFYWPLAFILFYDYLFILFSRNTPVFNMDVISPFDIDFRFKNIGDTVVFILMFKGRSLYRLETHEDVGLIAYLMLDVLKQELPEQHYKVKYLKRRANLGSINQPHNTDCQTAA